MHSYVYCSIIYNNQCGEAIKCPSIDKWIKEQWYMYTMEYYSTMKNNETLPFVTAWVDLENIVLSEINQTEKDKCHMISFICRL